jgi:hypothetical protein
MNGFERRLKLPANGLSAQATLLLFRDFDGFTDKWKLYFSKNN